MIFLIILISTLFQVPELNKDSGLPPEQTPQIKSLTYVTYKADYSNEKVTRGKKAYLPNWYPTKYPSAELHYTPEGLLIKEVWPDQKNEIIYDSLHRISKEILVRKSDTVIIEYHYDQHNMVSKMSKRLPDARNNTGLDTTELITEYYTNFFFSENDTIGHWEFNHVQMDPLYVYRLYDAQNRMVKEKFMSIKENPFPYKPDTIIKKQEYAYYKKDLPLKVSFSCQYLTTLGRSVKKGMHFKNHEIHEYLKDDKVHRMKYYQQGELTTIHECISNQKGELISSRFTRIKPEREEITIYNDQGVISSYTSSRKGKIKQKITFEYTFNEYGDWIRCVHYNQKGKPTYLTERTITYYPDNEVSRELESPQTTDF